MFFPSFAGFALQRGDRQSRLAAAISSEKREWILLIDSFNKAISLILRRIIKQERHDESGCSRRTHTDVEEYYITVRR
jgi:hypothetical protein